MEDPTRAAPNVLKEGGSDATGQEARLTALVGAMAVADVVKTTLGPKGMDKIIMTTGKHGSVTVTNDGATILKSISIDNAAAKILVDISKTQDEEVGDGTTSVCVLAGLLLEQAQELLQQHVHPQTICEGWRLACAEALKTLEGSAVDHSKDLSGFRQQLLKIARTTLSSKIVHSEMDLFANLAVDAILRLKNDLSLEHIQILKKSGGSMKESFLEEGFILDKKIGVGQPHRIEKAKVLVANTPMDTDKIKIYGSKVKVDSLAKVAEIEQAEVAKMMRKCEKIAAHNINCFINRQLIYNKPEQFFADRGIMAIEHADFDGIERLAAVLGGDIVSTFDTPEQVKLGSCELIDEVLIGEDRLIRFSGCAGGNACTVVLRGAGGHVLDEAERSLHDALCVLLTVVKDPRTICGGGCTETLMAQAVDALAAKTAGKKALAISGFATALRGIPRILADNGGFDSAELVAQLRAAHVAGKTSAGLNMIDGTIGDMLEMGISEPLRVKTCALVSASEAAEMILRVDQIIRAAPRPRDEDGRY